MAGLYIHTPFCVRKCIYCDFYSVESSTEAIATRLGRAQAPDAERFLGALELEFQRLPTGFEPETVFIGGGTPTELADSDFERLLRMVFSAVNIDAISEWTCEANPGTLTQKKAELMESFGVNRVSVGVQSFHHKNLEFLGRIHDGDDARKAVDMLRSAGISNLNLDLIFGIPGSSEEILRHDLRQIIELNPAHASCYCLMFEPGTPLDDLRKRGYVKETPDEDSLRQYNLVRSTYEMAGYRQYEISNFAKAGFECRHNLLYWGDGEYIGVGPSAASHWHGTRYENVRSIRKYCDMLHRGESARNFEERLDPETRARDTLVFALRRIDGVSTTGFLEDTGYAVGTLCGGRLKALEQEGFLEHNGDMLRLTEKGLYVSDAVFAELI
jgi:oxygen-independent coproporphyrinogen-3 oxidase